MSEVAIGQSDRGTIVGANGTGKSSLMAHLVATFRKRYPQGRVLISDTKPRWRATRTSDGRDARRLYRKMAEGDQVKDSVSMSRLEDWGLAWDTDNNPGQCVVLQRMDDSLSANVQFQTQAMERFFRSLDVAVPSLLCVDEGHDFFTANGTARGSDIIQRCYRAGRERGLATLVGFQRPKGINQQCLTEVNRLALFRINNRLDVGRLHEMGFPRRSGSPTYADGHAFRWWTGGPDAPLYRLARPADQDRKVS
jgi:hypothetical protein